MKKCLVTGASGLIGSHLVKSMAADHQIYAMGRKSVDLGAHTERVQHLPIDMTQPWAASDLPQEPIDAVIHLAQSEHFRDFPESALPVFEVNTASTLKLLDYARRFGAKTFILASTGGVYSAGNQPCSEDSKISLRPDLGFYISSKLCSEILAETYSPYLNVIIMRFFFVYGPGQRGSMLIPRLVQSVQEGKSITLQGQEGISINPTHVSDAVNSIQSALELIGSQVINIGGPAVYTLRQIGETIGEALGKSPRFEVHPDGETPQNLIADTRRMSELLGAPKIGFAEGVKDYIEYTYGLSAIS